MRVTRGLGVFHFDQAHQSWISGVLGVKVKNHTFELKFGHVIESKNAKLSTSFNVSPLLTIDYFLKIYKEGRGRAIFFRHKFFLSSIDKSIFSRKKWISQLSAGGGIRIWSMQQKLELFWIEKDNQKCLNSPHIATPNSVEQEPCSRILGWKQGYPVTIGFLL